MLSIGLAEETLVVVQVVASQMLRCALGVGGLGPVARVGDFPMGAPELAGDEFAHLGQGAFAKRLDLFQGQPLCHGYAWKPEREG